MAPLASRRRAILRLSALTHSTILRTFRHHAHDQLVNVLVGLQEIAEKPFKDKHGLTQIGVTLTKERGKRLC